MFNKLFLRDARYFQHPTQQSVRDIVQLLEHGVYILFTICRPTFSYNRVQQSTLIFSNVCDSHLLCTFRQAGCGNQAYTYKCIQMMLMETEDTAVNMVLLHKDCYHWIWVVGMDDVHEC